MATALKDSFPFDIARELAAAVSRHEPAFPAALFLERAGEGWDDLELMARGERIADALWAAASLPYPRLVGILVREMGPELERTEDNGMAPFRHLPVSYLIARRGSVQSWAIHNSQSSRVSMSDRLSRRIGFSPRSRRIRRVFSHTVAVLHATPWNAAGHGLGDPKAT